MLITSFAYHNSWRIGNQALHQLVANVSAALLFASIGFSSFFIYPAAYKGGAGAGERIIASLITPIAWNIMEMVRVSEFFSFGETLYYGLNQVFLLSVFGALAQMGLCEVLIRWRLSKRKEEKVKILTPAPVLAIALGLAVFYVIMLWGLGVHFFYWYARGYKALFF